MKQDKGVYYKEFGNFIKESRMEQNLSQEEVAKMAGLSQSYYARLEKGLRGFDLPMGIYLCKLLGLDINEYINKFDWTE